MMMRLLEKALKDAIKENNCVIGTKKILSSITNIKMIVISQSVTAENIKKIKENVQNEKISMIHFKGTSVALGKLCGLPFRVSTISLKSLNDTNIQSILKESEER